MGEAEFLVLARGKGLTNGGNMELGRGEGVSKKMGGNWKDMR